MAREQGGHGPPNFFENIGFLEILVLCWTIFRPVLLVKIKAMKPLNNTMDFSLSIKTFKLLSAISHSIFSSV